MTRLQKIIEQYGTVDCRDLGKRQLQLLRNDYTGEELEERYTIMWTKERNQYKTETAHITVAKMESISNTNRNRIKSLEQQMLDETVETIRQTKQSAINTAREKYKSKVNEIKLQAEHADVYASQVINGVIAIRGYKNENAQTIN